MSDLVAKTLTGRSTVFGLSRFQCLVLVELLLIGSMTLTIGSIFVPDWRLGAGSQFLYPSTLQQGFSERKYGLIYVEGLRKMSWAELSSSTCDRWGLYANTKSLFPIAPTCTDSPVNKAQCTSNFESHLETRCDVYASITLLSFITVGLLCIASVGAAGTAIAMLVVTLGTWKRWILASLFSCSIVALPITLIWGLLTWKWFGRLDDTGTFPQPEFGLGYWIAIGGAVGMVVAALVFWRLSAALKMTSAPNAKMGVSNANLLDMAEQKLLAGSQLVDDTDDEAPPKP